MRRSSYDVKKAVDRVVKDLRPESPLESCAQAKRYHVFYVAPEEETWRALKEPGPANFMAHLERLDGVRVVAVRSSPMTDEYEGLFKFDGYDFLIDMMWGGDLCLECDESIPEEIFNTVVDHLNHYRRVPWWKMLMARLRYARLSGRGSDGNLP